ncbi:hypothetical protein [Pseudomonas sp. BN102]|uniref:hypothetical protein n=1 Tax=Pseudomonas sp. BN102 TaxID=2567886 RepID=UPI002455CB6C|nr:hypothetical protein [Pseudomonas sp. BN102]MDH4612401.1 hypothetical protein [Pseudomonas sp. BN102]
MPTDTANLKHQFKGDPFIAGAPWARERTTNTIELEQDGEQRRGMFDIVLARGFPSCHRHATTWF